MRISFFSRYLMTLISLVADLISYPIFSAIGGMITVAIYSKRRNAAG